ncbi:uncharacterized protein LOC117651262 isoform X2 [Thrips palmi]|nr:uncharacterized protein LOC117651262 isoform X2 [Thrips palmi]
MRRLRDHYNNNNKCPGAATCVACAVVTDYDTLSAATSDDPENVLNLLKKLMPHMEPGSQQDSHEFLLNLLNAINNQLAQHCNACISKGKQVHYTECQNCPSRRENSELFWGFEIPIRHTVEEGLSECFRAALLEVDCECKKKAPTTRFLKIVTMPEILIVQLGRFQFENDRIFRVRDVSVIPFRLDLREYQDRGASDSSPPKATAATFKCVGLVLHYGNSANEGHYRAAAVVEGGRWRLFDDRVVKSASWATIQESDEVYFALYERFQEFQEGESPSPPPWRPHHAAFRRTYSAAAFKLGKHPPRSHSGGAFFPRVASTPKTSDAFDFALSSDSTSLPAASTALAATNTPARSSSSSATESATRLPARLAPLDGSFPSVVRDPLDGTPSSRSSSSALQLLGKLRASSSSSATTEKAKAKAPQWRTPHQPPRALTGARLDWSTGPVEERSTLHGTLDFSVLPASVGTPSLLESSTASAPVAQVLIAPKWRTSPIAVTAPLQTATDLPSPDSPSSRWTTTPNNERLSWCRPDAAKPGKPGKLLTKYDTSSSDDDRLPSARFEASPPPRPFKCQSCGKAFRAEAALLRHEVRHSLWLLPDSRPRACRQCRQQFPSLESLHRHMRKHTLGSGPSGLGCPRDCGIQFPDPGLLQRHLDAHGKPQFAKWRESPNVEGNKEHLCKTCKGHFQDCKTLSRHRKAFGEGRLRKPCSSCKRRSARRLKKLDYLTRIVPWQKHRDAIPFQ